jgi:hypothetical protein
MYCYLQQEFEYRTSVERAASHFDVKTILVNKPGCTYLAL